MDSCGLTLLKSTPAVAWRFFFVLTTAMSRLYLVPHLEDTVRIDQ
ncbi:hypothetical protein HDF16_005613 [Granulicella aggregans]|uniref:Uncharacterized protein n=1 Tax=Granulicella aggregans TaxID=474949 RepID=A0A7W7ZJ46_9BACT|nr:hypothetical protein [Granulicella aggregans]